LTSLSELYLKKGEDRRGEEKTDFFIKIIEESELKKYWQPNLLFKHSLC
jgi:hypothetical protein